MFIVNKLCNKIIFLLTLYKSIFSIPIPNADSHNSFVLKADSTTNKSFVCPWYCYPAIIFTILITLFVVTICLSLCDYRYSKKQQESKVIQYKTETLENKDDEEIKTINTLRPKDIENSHENDDFVSLTSIDDEKNVVLN